MYVGLETVYWGVVDGGTVMYVGVTEGFGCIFVYL